jgi:hypothetical protein
MDPGILMIAWLGTQWKQPTRQCADVGHGNSNRGVLPGRGSHLGLDRFEAPEQCEIVPTTLLAKLKKKKKKLLVFS